MIDTKQKQQYIQLLYTSGAFLITKEPKQLHHGGSSHLFLDHSTFLQTYNNLELLVNLYQTLIPNELQEYSLASVDSIMSPVITGVLAGKVKKNVIVTKEKKLEHGLEQQMYGKVTGEILLIDDVTSTGSILINAAHALREKKATVRYALLSACRDVSAIENLKKEGIITYYIATYEEIIRNIWYMLSEEEKNIILQEVTEKGYSWDIKP